MGVIGQPQPIRGDFLDPGRGLITPEPQVGGWGVKWVVGWILGHVLRRMICGTGRVQDDAGAAAITADVLVLYEERKHHKHCTRMAVERGRLYQYR